MNRTYLAAIVSLAILLASCKKNTESNENNVTTDSGNITYSTDGDTVFVTYNGSSASVVKPEAASTVLIEVSNGSVTVNSTIEKEMYYKLSGTTSNGKFKIYSENAFNLLMNGVTITNSDGPAINIQSGKKCNVSLITGTTNSFTDGSTYATSAEDQKATLFSEAALIFKGAGSLLVKSNSKHAICSDKYIDIQEGSITVSGAAKDGIHTNDYFTMGGGTVNITTSDDGINCEDGYVIVSGGTITTVSTLEDAKGIKSDSIMLISGGTLNITMNGNQSKGLKSTKNMTLSGGNITIKTTGAVVLNSSGSGYDPSYCTGIKCDSSIVISGADIIINSAGAGGKGISADNNITMSSGSLKITTTGGGATYKNTSGTTDSYSATCITADGSISLLGGSVTTSSSGTGGKGISASKTIILGESGYLPNISVTTTSTKFVVSGTDYCHPKAIKCDGSITINNGTIVISSSDDGIHAETSITQNNGNITINNSYEGVESKLITINGGTLSMNASNDGLNATAGLVSGGSESDDGSKLIINGGLVTSNATSGDAIDSNGSIVITGGTVIANGPSSGVEEACDFNGTFTMNGGLFIGSGSNSNMTKSMSSTSTQQNFYISTNSAISSSSLLHIQDSNGTDILTFKPVYGGYKFLFSSSSLSVGGSYSIYTGGSYTGGTSTNGLLSGGTYSATGATLKTTKTLSSSTTVNSVSF